MIEAMFRALAQTPRIDYVDMPFEIRDSYQYFTQAPVDNLRRAGWATEFTSLEQAVQQYVSLFLNRHDRYR